MRKIVLALLFLPSTLFAKEWFQANKPLDCGPFHDIVSIVTQKDINEEVAWIGFAQESQSQVALFLNPKTNTWTLVQYNTEFGCVLEIGQTYKTYKPKSNKSH